MLKDARYLEGCKYLEMGRFEDAESEFLNLLDEQPYHFEAINKMGVLAVKQGRFSEAREKFNKALSIEPAYAPALVNIGNLHLEENDLAVATDYYKQAIEADLDYPMSYYNLALVYKREGDYKKYVGEMKNYKRLNRRAQPAEDEQFRLHYKRKMGCLPTMIVSLLVIAIVAIGLL